MLEKIVELLLSHAGEGAGFLVGSAITYIAALRTENKAVKEGMKSLLRDRIIQGYNHYHEEKGWIPIYALESLNKCYASYVALGGNSTIPSLMEKIQNLPTHRPGEGVKHEKVKTVA